LLKSTQRRRVTRNTIKSITTKSTSTSTIRKRIPKLKRRRKLKRKLKRKKRLFQKLLLCTKRRTNLSRRRTSTLSSKVEMIWTVMIFSELKSLRIRRS
jgi:hypothetical protein